MQVRSKKKERQLLTMKLPALELKHEWQWTQGGKVSVSVAGGDEVLK